MPVSPLNQSKLIGNLLSNALEAAAEFDETREMKQIQLSTNIHSGLFIIEISNSSNPIPKEVLDHLYQSFGKTTKSGEHQGIGTYIIAKLIQEYHGSLHYDYRENRFTVKIKLPIIQ